MARGRGRPRSRKQQEETRIADDNVCMGDEDDNSAETLKDDSKAIREDASNSEDGDEEERKQQELWERFEEDHHEAVEQLPLSLHRIFRLMRDLDSQAHSTQDQLLHLLRSYIALRRHASADPSLTQPNDPAAATTSLSSSVLPSVGIVKNEIPDRRAFSHDGNSSSDSRTTLTRIASLVDDWVSAADEKLSLAQSAYNSVDRQVRVLDSEILERESLISGNIDSFRSPPTSIVGPHSRRSERTVRGRRGRLRHATENTALEAIESRHSNVENITTRRMTKRPAGETGAPASSSPLIRDSITTLPTHKGIDISVLPNEPVYCYCRQVSHGKMIGCDNSNCAREWFHYACVSLTEEPRKGMPWYCPDCLEALGRNSRRRK